jgi:hypothetical protein
LLERVERCLRALCEGSSAEKGQQSKNHKQ